MGNIYRCGEELVMGCRVVAGVEVRSCVFRGIIVVVGYCFIFRYFCVFGFLVLDILLMNVFFRWLV